MTVTTTDPTVIAEEPGGATADAPGDPVAGVEALVEDDLLVEDVSIDGMCGVY
jgi:mycofactocin precursor